MVNAKDIDDAINTINSYIAETFERKNKVWNDKKSIYEKYAQCNSIWKSEIQLCDFVLHDFDVTEALIKSEVTIVLTDLFMKALDNNKT